MPRKKRLGKTTGKKKVQRQYSDSDKRKACIEYWVSGTVVRAADTLGMPRETLQKWTKTDWWGEITQQVRDEVEDKIEADLVQILELSTRRVKDGLEKGDEKLVWDQMKKKHVKIRVLPSAKDSAVIHAISIDKRRVSLNMPTSIQAQGGNKAMESLMQQFTDLSRKHDAEKIKKINSIEAEVDDN